MAGNYKNSLMKKEINIGCPSDLSLLIIYCYLLCLGVLCLLLFYLFACTLFKLQCD